MFRRKKQFLLLMTACCLPLLCNAAMPQTPASTERPFDFSQIAKSSTPAVVSIKVAKTAQHHSKVTDDFEEEGDTADSEGSFWQDFFRSPNKSEIYVGQASGFIVSPDGLILTNNHVVEDVTKIVVTLNDGTEYAGKLVGLDNNTDIALIKIEEKNLPYLKLGNSDAIEVGQWILAIGTPFGLQATVTAGIISAKGRNNLDLARIEDFIQTDTAINRGNSGGPLINMNGEVIGINTAIVGNLEGNLGGNLGIGFSVPSNIAKNVMEQLVSKGKVSRSFIGLDLQPLDHDRASAFGLHKSEGAIVSQVVKNSPASKAGIKQGDVIVKLNENAVSSVGGFRTSIALMTPGSKLKLSLIRDGKPMDIALETSELTRNSLEQKASEEAK